MTCFDNHPPIESESAVLATTRFSVRYETELRELFALLGAPWSNDPAANVQTAQNLWLGKEHGKIITTYTDDQLAEVIPLGEAMDMHGAILPPAGTILEASCIIGGTLKANLRRYGLVRHAEDKLNCHLGPIVGWYGQRLREERDGTIEQNLDQLRDRNAGLLEHSWVQEQLRLDINDPNPWLRPFATEYEIGILAALLEFGPSVTIAHTERIEESSRLPGVPGRTILWQRLTRPGRSDLIMFNAAAQERILNNKPADPRHTTASCAEEWLRVFKPKPHSKLGMISGNPHTLRTIMDVDRVLAKAGRSDLEVTVMGTSAAITPLLAKAMLGEVARLLNNEQRNT